MAHYAEIINDKVARVLVMNNDWTDQECKEWLAKNVSKNEWVQTSYNGNIRSKYAGLGDEYNRDLDAFVSPKPYPSWQLNRESKRYEAPLQMPDDSKPYKWNEELGRWEEVKLIP